VHELTHAVCDDRCASFLNKQQSEAIAYVAQCLFVVKKGSTIYDDEAVEPILPTDTKEQRQDKYRKFAVGTEIAHKIKFGVRNVSKSDENRMLFAMRNDGEGTGRAHYNGIDRTPQF
jgi:hypothetical protein